MNGVAEQSTWLPQDQAPLLLELIGVSAHYDGVLALEDVTFQVRRGDRVAIVGPNGAGKSTLFNVIAGILKPAQGRVVMHGSGPNGRLNVGYVPQRNRIDWRFPVTVADVVMMGRVGRIGLLRRPGRRDREAVASALEQVDMAHLAHRQIGELSGGQQQRVFLARALAQEAELLLLDEPFTGLDLPSQEALLEILERLHGQGITMLVATHDLTQAAQFFPQILLLNRRVIAYGTPEQVLTSEMLGQAYGSQMHAVSSHAGELLLADTCCGGGLPPVEKLLGTRERPQRVWPIRTGRD
ncbi:MAG: ABC transporter [Litorilinea sp.]|nr:MAG: ABC transporter [Litorilinea sp.]